MANLTQVSITTYLEVDDEDKNPTCAGIDFINEQCPFVNLRLCSRGKDVGGTRVSSIEVFGWAGRALSKEDKQKLFNAFAQAPWEFPECCVLYMYCENECTPVVIYHEDATVRSVKTKWEFENDTCKIQGELS